MGDSSSKFNPINILRLFFGNKRGREAFNTQRKHKRTIEKDLIRDGGHTCPNLSPPLIIKTIFFHHTCDHRPFNPIIGLAHIDFNSPMMRRGLSNFKEIKHFTSNQDVVGNISPLNKDTLIGGDNLWENNFKPISH